MAQILAPSQRVSFKDTVCDSREVQLLKQTMSPTLNCFPAYKWAIFRALSLAKDMADAALSHDDLKLVMSLYAIAAVTVAVCTFTYTEAPAQRQTFLLASPEAAEACDILYLEAMVNAACCAVKTGDSNVLLEAGEGVQRCMSRREAQYGRWASVPPQLEAYCNSVLLWRGLYSGIQCKMPTVGDMVRLWTGPNCERHQKHDREVLLRQPDQEAEMSRKHLPLEQCSAFQLPLPSIACHKALLEQHEGRFKDWLDMDLLRSLPDNLKEEVNRQQKQYKIKVTAFDELGL